jgi:hypothetical protein
MPLNVNLSASPSGVPGHGVQIGCFARDVIDGARSGCVTAVFERSGYIEVDGDWVCVANVDAGYNAVTISVRSSASNDWLDYFQVGAPVVITPSLLSISDCPAVNLSPLMPWSPAVAQSWSLSTLSSGLQALTKWVPDARLPADGLGQYLYGSQAIGVATRESNAAGGAIADLTQWLCGVVDSTGESGVLARSVRTLIGLGPGLTPSGDDFLAGMLIALSACGAKRWQHQLGNAVQAGLQGTGPVSQTHLKAAVKGEGGEALHQALVALMAGEGDRLGPALSALDRVGHTSGWDGLAGVVTVLRAIMGRPFLVLDGHCLS